MQKIDAGLNHALHNRMDPPKGYKGSKWSDDTGSYENNNDGSWYATSPNGEKYTFIEDIELRGKSLLIHRLDNAADGLGLSISFKEFSFKYAKQLGNDLTHTKYFKYGVERLGIITGAYGAVSSTRDFINNPNLKTGTKATISILSGNKYVHPFVGLTLGIADITGFTDWALKKIYGK